MKFSPDSFLGKYIATFEEMETPRNYDLWCGLWILSNAVGRDVIIERPGAPLRLNLYVALIGEAGRLRKSTAIGHATQVVKRLTEVIPNVVVVEGKSTSESLQRSLSETSASSGEAHLCFSVSELVTVLGRESYTKNLPPFLVDMFDCPGMRTQPGTLRSGNVLLKNIYSTFLSGSAPTWLERAISPEVISGGFTSRTLFIVEHDPKRSVPWPVKVELDLDGLCAELLSLRETARKLGRIDIYPDALRAFSKWYTLRHAHTDPFRSTFEGREDSHVLKLAALLAINDQLFKIEKRHVKFAIQAIEKIKATTYLLFSLTRTSNKNVVAVTRIRDLLVKRGADWTPRGDVHRAVADLVGKPRLDSIMKALIDHSFAQTMVSKGRGRPMTIYRATQKILDPRMMNTVTDQLVKAEQAS